MEILMVRSDAQASRLEPWHTDKKTSLHFPSFADLVVLARSLNPFPYRTRPLNSSAPMVLSLKAWKSRSLPGLPRTENFSHDDWFTRTAAPPGRPFRVFDTGWLAERGALCSAECRR